MSYASDWLNKNGIPVEDKPSVFDNVKDYFSNYGEKVKTITDAMSQSKIGGQIQEWFGTQNPYSAEGQQRTENQRARDFSAEQAEIQRDFEERMSNTSFQRGMTDMQAAGLNPILAYGQGGASTPSGAAANGAGTAHTADSNPISQIGRIAQIVLGGVSAGARISSMSHDNAAKILSQEEMQDKRLNHAYALHNEREVNRNMQHLDKINFGYLSRHRKEN